MGGQAKREAKKLVETFGWQVSHGDDHVTRLYGVCPLCFNYEIIDEPWPIEDKKLEEELREAAVKNHVCGPVNELGKRTWEGVL